MQKTLSISVVAALAAFGPGAQAQDITARVISATPVVQQVLVPRTVCSNQPVAVQQPATGGGALIGAIAGGLLGAGVGGGMGQVAATGLGIVAGAAVGDRVERNGPGTVQIAQGCATQTFAENRTVGYNVTYDYGGRQYTVQMPNDPGPAIRLQMSPVAASAPSNPYPVASGEVMSAPVGTVSVPGVVASATTVYPGYATTVYPAYAAPAYPAYYPGYYPGYFAPIGLSLGFGFSNGWGGWGHRGHGHHRGGGHRR